MAQAPTVDRRQRTKPVALVATVLSVAALSLGPIVLMARSRADLLIMFLTCLPFSGLSFAWLWRERRRMILRWAAICFAAAVGCWLLFFLYFVFQSRDESRGLVLIAADILTNCILFVLLDRAWKRRQVRVKPEEEMVVL
jgi:peptidoglycan/LPS O-acetylase OafA/YrhL